MLHFTTDAAGEVRARSRELRGGPFDVVVGGRGLANAALEPVPYDGREPALVRLGAVTLAALRIERSDGSPRRPKSEFLCTRESSSGNVLRSLPGRDHPQAPSGTVAADDLRPLERRMLELAGLDPELDLRGAVLFVGQHDGVLPEFCSASGTVWEVDTSAANYQLTTVVPSELAVVSSVLVVRPTAYGEVEVAFEGGAHEDAYRLLGDATIRATYTGDGETLPPAYVESGLDGRPWVDPVRIRLPLGRWDVGIRCSLLDARPRNSLCEPVSVLVTASSPARVTFEVPAIAGIRLDLRADEGDRAWNRLTIQSPSNIAFHNLRRSFERGEVLMAVVPGTYFAFLFGDGDFAVLDDDPTVAPERVDAVRRVLARGTGAREVASPRPDESDDDALVREQIAIEVPEGRIVDVHEVRLDG
ncbi:MAG: hypothetical protein R3F34_02260 [Planctomycetota bacterium]